MSYEHSYDPEPLHASSAAFPWPPTEGESIPAAFAHTWRGASLRPRTFFGSMPEHGSLGAALLYYLPIGIVASAGELIWTLLRPAAAAEREAVLGADMMVSPLIQFLLSPLLLIILIFIAAGAVHLLLRIFGGASRDFAFTTRVFAFAYSPQILGIIPAVGSLIGSLWMIVVAIIGLREGHRTSTPRVLAAVLIPLAILLFFTALAYLLGRAGGLLEL